MREEEGETRREKKQNRVWWNEWDKDILVNRAKIYICTMISVLITVSQTLL